MTIKNKHVTINLEIEKEKGGENKMQTYTIEVGFNYEPLSLYSAVGFWSSVEAELAKIKEEGKVLSFDKLVVTQWNSVGEKLWSESYEKGEF